MDARSYGGICTDTDHKLVKATLRVEWHKTRNTKDKTVKVDTSNFYNEQNQAAYKVEVLKSIDKISQQATVQNKWNTICTICNDAGEKVLGTIKNHKENKDGTLQKNLY